jgi:hypothetical protein
VTTTSAMVPLMVTCARVDFSGSAAALPPSVTK